MSDTIADFFGLNDPAQAQQGAEALQNSPDFAGGSLPEPLRAKAATALIWAAKAMLRDPLSGVLGEGWGKVTELQKFDTAPPDEINTFSLQSHEIALSRQPSIELDVNGAPSGIIFAFELKLGFTVESAELRIQQRRIIGAQFGGLRGGGTLSLGRATILKRETAQVQLPAQVEFDPGIRVR